MVTFADSLRDTIRGATCAYLDTNEAINHWIYEDSLFPVTPPTLVLIRSLQRWFCNREPSAATAPPFTGGQCSINYVVNITWSRDAFIAGSCTSVDEGTSVPFVLGPIIGLEVEQLGTYEQRLNIVHGPGGASRTAAYTYTGTSACPANFSTYAITSVTPPSGVSDNCGNPSPDLTPDPYPSGPLPYDVPYTDVNGDDWNIPININFVGPTISLDGSIQMNFGVSLDLDFDTRFNGTVNLQTGDVNINFNGPNYSPGRDKRPDDYVPSDNLPDYPPTIPDPVDVPSPQNPDNSTSPIIRACIVTVSENGFKTTLIPQDDNPDILVPDLGFVQFAIGTREAYAWTGHIKVNNFRQFIPCPWEGGALGVLGTPRPGVEWTISYVYAAAELPQAYAIST